MSNWSGKKVVVLGAARQGLATARYLARHGAQVVMSDRRPADELRPEQEALAGAGVVWVCGGHPTSLLEGADAVCVSGGVPLTLPLLLEARDRRIPLTNDSQIFLEAAPCRVIGITGSAGKTTTTTLMGRMAQAAVEMSDEGRTTKDEGHLLSNIRPTSFDYRRIWVGGNIGAPLISVVDEMQPDDLAVMELSSFQLELMTRSPQVAAVLNLTPNHLDRHGTMRAYSAAKARILEFQSGRDTAVLGRDDPGSWELAPKVRGRLLTFGIDEPPEGLEGTFVRDGELYLRTGDQGSRGIGESRIFAPTPVRSSASAFPYSPGETRLMSRSEIGLRGEHNLLNTLAACAAAAAAGLPVEAMRAGVIGFHGVPHRLEFVRTWGGGDWYNDSIATAPERAMAAIRSFEEPLVLLAGGRDKDLPWADFASLVRQRVDHLILFGEAAGMILQAVQESRGKREKGNRGIEAASPLANSPSPLLPFSPCGEGRLTTISHCATLHEAVQAAAQIVQPGDVVLLAPGGTSFDEFRDFEERGEWFKNWVMQL